MGSFKKCFLAGLSLLFIVQSWATALCGNRLRDGDHPSHPQRFKIESTPAFAVGKRSAIGLLVKLKNGQHVFVAGSPATDGHAALYSYVNETFPVESIIWHGEFESNDGVISHANETAGISQQSQYKKDNASVDNLKDLMNKYPEAFSEQLGLRIQKGDESPTAKATQWKKFKEDDMHLSWQQALLSNARHDNKTWDIVLSTAMSPEFQPNGKVEYGAKFLEADSAKNHDTYVIQQDLLETYKKFLALCKNAEPRFERVDLESDVFNITDYIQANTKVTKLILQTLIEQKRYPSEYQYNLLREMLGKYSDLAKALQSEAGNERYNFKPQMLILPK